MGTFATLFLLVYPRFLPKFSSVGVFVIWNIYFDPTIVCGFVFLVQFFSSKHPCFCGAIYLYGNDIFSQWNPRWIWKLGLFHRVLLWPVHGHVSWYTNCISSFYTAYFHLSGYVNSQNYRTWSTQNPHVFVETDLHPIKIGFWVAISRRRIIGPIFFNETINADRCRTLILDNFVNQLDEEKRDFFFFNENLI